MTAVLDDLRRVPLFAGMTDRALEAVAELAAEQEFGDGDALLTEGEPGASNLLLVDGQVRVTRAGSPVRTLTIQRDGFLQLMDRFAAVRLGVLMALTDRVRTDEQQPISC